MKRTFVFVSAFALVLAACSSDGGSEVASLAEVIPEVSEAVEDGSVEAIDEDAILTFAQCMRDNGVEDFEDPDIGADGSVGFGFRGAVPDSDADRETMRAAFEVCQDELGGISFGRGGIDRSEIEDTLYEFAVCMRENGIDLPDPDFSSFLESPGPGNGGPFGGEIDPNDPAFAAALEACEDVFGGTLRLGRGPGGDG